MREFAELLAKFAPIVTAGIALFAAYTAVKAINAQRDTARRRAAIDFFLKTETEDKLIEAYNEFKTLIPKIPEISKRETLSLKDPEYKAWRKWMNLCELIAVGVNKEAFSEHISFDYWADVIPEAYEKSLPLIERTRAEPLLGTSKTFCELETLAKRWIAAG